MTKHTDGNLFWPSMSSDGKVIVYEDNFGIWKLDVASGKTSEIKLDIATDEKDNEVEIETVTNEVDSFDISPSGRRAVISARGQILTIATDRGDITRIVPDKMASRNDNAEVVARRQVRRVRLATAPAATRSGSAIRKARTPKKITDLDNEKGALVWTPDSKSLLYTAADKKLYSYTVADGKTSGRRVERPRAHRLGLGLARQQVGRVLEAGSHAPLARLHRPDRRRRGASPLRRQRCSTPRPTRSGPPTAATSSSPRPRAPAAASPRRAASSTTMELWAMSLRDQDRDPMNRDIDNEAQGLAAEAAARQQPAAAAVRRQRAASPKCKIDWSGLARRARRLTVPGTAIGGLTPSPEGHSVALTVATAGAGGGRGGAAADPNAGMYIINVESGQLTRVPPARRPRATAADADAAARSAAAAGSAAAAWCSRATAARCTSARAAASSRRRSAEPGRRRRPAARAADEADAAADAAPAAAGRNRRRPTPTARQVTYTVNLEVDHKALRAQVFNEGWRIMKNRFYDAKMHGADWNGGEGQPTSRSSTTSSTTKSCTPS